ncbi:MAG: hypothetical protein JJE02_01545 [Propionibacteriales bacterium]|nr:hypothetical protein [Propionibacteriales bacterium]
MTDGPSYPGDPNPNPTPNPGSGNLPPYGQVPEGGYPPPPTGNYPPPTPGPHPFSVGNAFSYGWAKFKDNLGPMVVAASLLFVVTVVAEIVGSIITAAAGGGGSSFSGDSAGGMMFGGDASAAGQLTSLLMNLIVTVVGYVVSAGIIRGALDITEGRKFDIAHAFGQLDYGKVILTSLLVGVLTTIGLVLFILPGILVAFFTTFALYFVVDNGTEPMESVKASFALVKDHVGDVVVLFLASIAAVIVGVLACLVGLLVAIPVVTIAWAYAYKTLQGQPVS